MVVEQHGLVVHHVLLGGYECHVRFGGDRGGRGERKSIPLGEEAIGDFFGLPEVDGGRGAGKLRGHDAAKMFDNSYLETEINQLRSCS